MPIRQLADAGAQSTCSSPITAAQTSATLVSASGFPAILSGGQQSVTILDSGNPAYNPAAPLATPYEYQPVNAIAGNVLTFGTGGGGASRAAYASTTPHGYFAGATIAAGILAEDIFASVPWKFDEQTPSGVSSVRIPASGSIPASYLGVNFRRIEIDVQGRSSNASGSVDLQLRANSDVGGDYDWQRFFGAGAGGGWSAGEGHGVTFMALGFAAGASAPQNSAAHTNIILPNFASTVWDKFFTAHGTLASAYSAGNLFNVEASGVWRQGAGSAVAVTSLTVLLSAGTFVAGSLITTYLWP
jgi:hypothetical protein